MIDPRYDYRCDDRKNLINSDSFKKFLKEQHIEDRLSRDTMEYFEALKKQKGDPVPLRDFMYWVDRLEINPRGTFSKNDGKKIRELVKNAKVKL